MLDFAQKTEPGTLHLFLQKLLSTIEPQELQCLLPTRLNNVNWKQWSVSCACLDGEEDGGQKTLRELQGKRRGPTGPNRRGGGKRREEEEGAPPLHKSAGKLLSTIEPQELQCLLPTRLNMAKKMLVKLPEGATAAVWRCGGAAALVEERRRRRGDVGTMG
ncbi:hypothetical protein INR49_026045 [Caranx melampygus]|nr:hypothetical protein INR49_026045 [Caranx melampygus]